MLTYEQALACILKAAPAPRIVMVRLAEALGLILARPIGAGCHLPQFDNSAVDGYAIRLHDIPEAVPGHEFDVILRIVGNAEAGRPFRRAVRTGEAVRILTGAQMPRGADTVVMQEHVIRRDHQLVIQRRPTHGQHIRRRGEDLRQGTRILKAGLLLRPQELGLLAAVGIAQVPVYPRPTVAILTSGDELMSPGTRLKPGQIYESNGLLLRALVQQTGARAIDLGTARDTVPALIRKVRRGLEYDLLVISGGVSVGDKDLVRQAAQRCGVQQILWQVNIKPGMPLFVGTHRSAGLTGAAGKSLVFGLPGNPVSVFVTFEEFVKPAIYRLMGRQWQDQYTEPAVLIEDLQVSRTRRTHFLRVRCSQHRQLVAEPLDGQGSHRLRSLVEADGWIRMNVEQGPWSAGAQVFVKPTALPVFHVEPQVAG